MCVYSCQLCIRFKEVIAEHQMLNYHRQLSGYNWRRYNLCHYGVYKPLTISSLKHYYIRIQNASMLIMLIIQTLESSMTFQIMTYEGLLLPQHEDSKLLPYLYMVVEEANPKSNHFVAHFLQLKSSQRKWRIPQVREVCYKKDISNTPAFAKNIWTLCA